MKTFSQIRRETHRAEIEQAKQSNLKDRTIDGHHYQITMHAAFRATARHGDMNKSDWDEFLDNAHEKLKHMPADKYLVTSKKHDQSVAINKNDDAQSNVITVFVKGTHRLRPDTKQVMVEGFFDPLVYILID